MRNATSLSFVLGTLLGCASADISDGSQAAASATIYVTNSACASAPCGPIDVLAFPSNNPNVPGGAWRFSLGRMTTPTACFSIPKHEAFYITSTDMYGYGHTDSVVWTPSIRLSLAAVPPDSNQLQLSASTSGFVPSSASGWAVSFPDGQITSRTACAVTSN